VGTPRGGVSSLWASFGVDLPEASLLRPSSGPPTDPFPTAPLLRLSPKKMKTTQLDLFLARTRPEVHARVHVAARAAARATVTVRTPYEGLLERLEGIYLAKQEVHQSYGDRFRTAWEAARKKALQEAGWTEEDFYEEMDRRRAARAAPGPGSGLRPGSSGRGRPWKGGLQKGSRRAPR
jgi:hypothetical protein